MPPQSSAVRTTASTVLHNPRWQDHDADMERWVWEVKPEDFITHCPLWIIYFPVGDGELARTSLCCVA